MDVRKMKKVTKKYIFSIAVIAWFVLWLNFLMRDLVFKGGFKKYASLFKASRYGKYEIVYGKSLFEFLAFVKESVPENSKYAFSGIEPLSLEWRRAIYYLYPMMASDRAEYILVFEKPSYTVSGYELLRKLDDGRFILRRK